MCRRKKRDNKFKSLPEEFFYLSEATGEKSATLEFLSIKPFSSEGEGSLSMAGLFVIKSMRTRLSDHALTKLCVLHKRSFQFKISNGRIHFVVTQSNSMTHSVLVEKFHSISVSTSVCVEILLVGIH